MNTDALVGNVMYTFDPTYIMVIIGFVLTLFASFGVNSTFNKYKGVANRHGITGAMAARKILDANGLQNVRVVRIPGSLTDNFNPSTNVVSLSDSTYDSVSVAAIGVAAHECGHAVQHQQGYAPIKVRNGIYPVVRIGNMASMPLFLIGLIMGIGQLAMVGALLFGLVLLFQLVTLPVEFNASSRAIKTLEGMYMLDDEEIKGARKVLTAAAMTYVAAAAATALQFLRLLMLANRRRK